MLRELLMMRVAPQLPGTSSRKCRTAHSWASFAVTHNCSSSRASFSKIASAPRRSSSSIVASNWSFASEIRLSKDLRRTASLRRNAKSAITTNSENPKYPAPDRRLRSRLSCDSSERCRSSPRSSSCSALIVRRQSWISRSGTTPGRSIPSIAWDKVSYSSASNSWTVCLICAGSSFSRLSRFSTPPACIDCSGCLCAQQASPRGLPSPGIAEFS